MTKRQWTFTQMIPVFTKTLTTLILIHVFQRLKVTADFHTAVETLALA